jgi:LmbE family N-acetylglucosaminyl deacetylase
VKVTIYSRPAIVVALLGGVATLLSVAAGLSGGTVGGFLDALALFYSALTAISIYALWRCRVLGRAARWDAPERLLILAPHEDDCVISAGGIGARNLRLGGIVRIVYLVRDEHPGMPEIRATEAQAAWREAGLDAADLQMLDLLPPLRGRDPRKLRMAARTLRKVIDDFAPTALVMPMFEGGHVQHDMTAAVVGKIWTSEDRFALYEAPEYGPYVSLNNTPHRVVSLCARWLLGLISYSGPADGIDDREILAFELDPADLDCKRRMLAAFASQNAPSLVATYGYPDRLVRWDPARRRRHPYEFEKSYLRLSLAARWLLPGRWAARLFGIRGGAIGREDAVTDWDAEWTIEGGASQPDSADTNALSDA